MNLDAKETPINIVKGTLSVLSEQANEIGILLSFCHQAFASHSVSIAPAITYSRALPEDSTIFNVVRAGDLGELQKMLRDREAFLSDRDTRGRCLLNVSTSHDTLGIAEVTALGNVILTLSVRYICCSDKNLSIFSW